MDLMVNIVVSVLTLVASVLTSILAHDICLSANRTCAKIIKRAALRLAPIDQEAVELEWLGDLDERETVWEKYRHALGCYIAAGSMRRRSLTLTIALNFHVTGVGTVPLTIELGPSLLASTFFMAASTRMPRWVRRASIVAFIIYTFGKLLLSAHRIGPGSLKRFLQETNRFKEWGYEAHLGRRGLDLDLSKILRAMVLNPSQIPLITKTLNDALNKKVGE
jgi:hypothetical protein